MLNGREKDEDRQKEIDSSPHVKKIMKNLTNSEMHTHDSVLE
jgi:hypothetical protein